MSAILGQFNVVRSTVGNDITAAQYIFLGERHDNDTDRQKNAALIDKHYRPGDSVLVEGVQSGEKAHRSEQEQTKHVTQKVSILGWDDLHSTCNEKSAMANRMFLPTIMLYSDKIREIKNLLKDAGISNEESARRMQELQHVEEKKSLLEVELTYHEMHSDFPRRTEKMISSLKSAAEKTGRIFLIAGKLHLKEDENGHSLLSLDGFKEYISDKRVMILFPKDDE